MKNATTDTGPASEIDLALCRATLYSALALGFRPPSEETITRLGSQQGAAALAEAAALLDPHQSGLAAACLLLTAHSSWFDRAHHDPEPAEGSLLTLTASHRRLFGHTARGVVPPYETEYGTEALFQQPQEMGDLMGFYRAFGLTLNPTEHERADHISCELEFLTFLALKEAYALEHRDVPMLEQTREATRLFLRDHLARFVPVFTKKLAREARGGFYNALADLCHKWVTQECARYRVPLGPENLPLRPATDGRAPMACGSGAECMFIPSPQPSPASRERGSS